MKSKIFCLTACIVVGLFAGASANAQFHLPGALGGGSSSNSNNTVAAQDGLVRSFVISQTEVLAAQSLLAQAYGLKDEAALLDAQQKALQGDAVDTDSLKKVVDVSNNANDAITAQQNAQATLTAAEKEYYAQSLPHFIKGVIGTRELIMQAKKFVATTKGSMGLNLLGGGMAKMKADAYVAKEAPSYSKNLFDVFRKTLSISQSNGVKVPSDATQAMGSL